MSEMPFCYTITHESEYEMSACGLLEPHTICFLDLPDSSAVQQLNYRS